MQSSGTSVRTKTEKPHRCCLQTQGSQPWKGHMPDTVNIVRFHQFGDASVLQLDQLPLPSPGQGEVRLRVKAIGLNRAEIMFREGKYVMQAGQLPSKLGFEASGIVEAVGEAVDPSWVGRTASCMPTFPPDRYGVYGEVAILPVSAMSVYPERLSFEEGTAIWAQYLTVWGGLIYFGGLRKGDHVLVTAASSSTGLAAIQTIRAEGGISIATTRTAAKREELLAFGADYVIVTKEEDLVSRVRDITGGFGARLIYDPIGGKGLETLVMAAATSATIIEYGLLATEPTVLPLFTALGKYLTIKAYDVHEVFSLPEQLEAARQYILRRITDGSYIPRIAKTFPLTDIAEAHRYMESNTHIGKIVVTV